MTGDLGEPYPRVAAWHVCLAAGPGRRRDLRLPDPGGSTEELVLAADRALYAAKNAGRNRVASADEPDLAGALAA